MVNRRVCFSILFFFFNILFLSNSRPSELVHVSSQKPLAQHGGADPTNPPSDNQKIFPNGDPIKIFFIRDLELYSWVKLRCCTMIIQTDSPFSASSFLVSSYNTATFYHALAYHHDLLSDSILKQLGSNIHILSFFQGREHEQPD